MITLYPFQQTAADQIAARVTDCLLAPVMRGRGVKRRVPFVQFVSSITASGKTVMLAEAVAQIAASAPSPPIVLWVSKLTVVVEQSFGNLAGGGLYHDLIDDFDVRPLAEMTMDDVRHLPQPFLCFATTGTFNIKGMEGRKVFESGLDEASENHSVWESLRLRPDPSGVRRPLLVVYDEAHNLSNQQTELLLKLEPDAFILATATPKAPALLETEVLEPLTSVGEFTAEELRTVVPAHVVAESGLVKQTVELVGRQGPMEDVILEMVAELRLAEADGPPCGLVGRPKAVYVCRTNIVEGDKQRDDPKQPFTQRQAPPILIWRHLVEGLGIDPADVVAYCDLKVDRNHPLPESFNLLRGGEKDYASFVKADYHHIIFNQTLQEGWDDPLVYFAYIDKTMGSTIAAEQIVGRLLRQPGRMLYSSPLLNGAEVHVRVESNKVFEEVVAKTSEKLRSDVPTVTVTKTSPDQKLRRAIPPRGTYVVPEIAIHTEDAIDAMAEIIDNAPRFKSSDDNTTGIGRKAVVQRLVGSQDDPAFEWEEVGTSSKVVARWLFNRALRRFHRDVAAAITLDDPKWDVKIGIGSPAAEALEGVAEKVGLAFVTNSWAEVADDDDEDYIVGNALVREKGFRPFDNAVHEGYDGLNDLEKEFAGVLDKTGNTWCRNPSKSGYGVPIVRKRGNDAFYPDFIVWAHGDVYLVDTKGGHLLEDAKHKLIRIRQSPGRPKLHIRFVTQARLDHRGEEVAKEGLTVISYRPDGEAIYTYVGGDMKKAVQVTLKAVK